VRSGLQGGRGPRLLALPVPVSSAVDVPLPLDALVTALEPPGRRRQAR
jgi:hypothetical protein